MDQRRVVYVATGETYVREALESMQTLWRHNPSTRVLLYVDPASTHIVQQNCEQSKVPEALLDVAEHPRPTFSPLDKSLALCETDLEQVLYLDTDTWIMGSIEEVFDLLKEFDLAVAHDAIRFGKGQPQSLIERAPVTFPELNTGVIAFRQNPVVKEFLDHWRFLHGEVLESQGKWVGDQGSFRIALLGSGLRFTVLAPEYNCHTPFPVSLDGPVRILHGRYPHHPALMERGINKTHDPRAYLPGLGTLRPSVHLIIWRQRYHAMREEGLLPFVRSRIQRRLTRRRDSQHFPGG